MRKILFPFIIVIAWLIPGSGHWFLGKRTKALVILGLILITLAAGLLLSDFRNVRFGDNPFYYVGRYGAGLVWLATIWLTQHTPRGIIPFRYFEIGLLYVCIAGALNAVVVLNLFGSALAGSRSLDKKAAKDQNTFEGT